MLGVFLDVIFELVLDLFLFHVNALQDYFVSANDVLAQVFLSVELVLHVFEQRGMVLLFDIVGLNQSVGFICQLQLLISDLLDVPLQDTYSFVQIRLVEGQISDPLLVLELVDLTDGINPFNSVLEAFVDFDLFLQSERFVDELLLVLQNLVVLLGARNFHVVQCRLQLLDLSFLQSDSVTDMIQVCREIPIFLGKDLHLSLAMIVQLVL